MGTQGELRKLLEGAAETFGEGLAEKILIEKSRGVYTEVSLSIKEVRTTKEFLEQHPNSSRFPKDG